MKVISTAFGKLQAGASSISLVERQLAHSKGTTQASQNWGQCSCGRPLAALGSEGFFGAVVLLKWEGRRKAVAHCSRGSLFSPCEGQVSPGGPNFRHLARLSPFR